MDLKRFKITQGEWWALGKEVGTVPMMAVKVAKVSGGSLEEAEANAVAIADLPKIFNLLSKLVKSYELRRHMIEKLNMKNEYNEMYDLLIKHLK